MPGRDRVDRAPGSTGGSRGAASGARAGKSDPTGKSRSKSLPASSRAARTGLQSGPHGMASRSGRQPRGRGTADPGRNGLPGFSSRSPLTVHLGSCGPELCARGSDRWSPHLHTARARPLQHHCRASTLPQVPHPLAAQAC